MKKRDKIVTVMCIAGFILLCFFLFSPVSAADVEHLHTEACYNGVAHMHEGDTISGGKCYFPVYTDVVCGKYTIASRYRCSNCSATSGNSGNHYVTCDSSKTAIEYTCNSCGNTSNKGGTCSALVDGTVSCGGSFVVSEYECRSCGTTSNSGGTCSVRKTCGGSYVASEYTCNYCGYVQNHSGSCGNEEQVTCSECDGAGSDLMYRCNDCGSINDITDYVNNNSACISCDSTNVSDYNSECDKCYGNGTRFCTAQTSVSGYACNKCGATSRSGGTCSKQIICEGSLEESNYKCDSCGEISSSNGICSALVNGTVTCEGSLEESNYECNSCGTISSSGGTCTEQEYCGVYNAYSWKCTGCNVTNSNYKGEHIIQVLDSYKFSCEKTEGHFYNGSTDVTEYPECSSMITDICSVCTEQTLSSSSEFNNLVTVTYFDGSTAIVEAESDFKADMLYREESITLKLIGQYLADGSAKEFISSTTVTTNYTYIVSFDANGGTCDIVNQDVEILKTYGTLPEANRKGYNFKGWYTLAEGGTEVKAADEYSLMGNQTLYAQWEINSYEVSLQETESGASGSGTYEYGEAITINAGKKRGYSFDGWEIVKGNVELDDATRAETSFVLSDGDVILKATWVIGKYNVELSNVGVDASGSGSYEYNAVVTICAGTIPGQRFLSWESPILLDDVNSDRTSFSMPEEDVSICAEWVAVTHVSCELNSIFYDTYASAYDGTAYDIDSGIVVSEDMVTVTVYLDDGSNYVLPDNYVVENNGVVGLSGKNNIVVTATVYGNTFSDNIVIYGTSERLDGVLSNIGVSSYEELVNYLIEIMQTLENKDKEIERLQELLDDKENTLQNLTAKYGTTLETIEKLQEEIEKLKSPVEELNKSESEKLSNALKVANQEIGELKSTISQLQEKIEMLESSDDGSNESESGAEEPSNALKEANREIAKLESTISLLQSDIDNAEAVNLILEENVSTLTAERDNIAYVYEMLTGDYMFLKEAYDKLQSEIEQLKNATGCPDELKTLGEVKRALAEKENEVITLTEKVTQYETKIVTLEKNVSNSKIVYIILALLVIILVSIAVLRRRS